MTDRAASGDLLPADLTMAEVTLHVADLDLMSAYYRDALGLTELKRTGTTSVLGRDIPLVVLRHAPGLPTPGRHEAGLFHTALLFETRADLAMTLYSALRHPQSRFAGSADHLVSEAFYFTDPEGNGIELYWDRPRTEWKWQGKTVAMDTIYLDPVQFLETHLPNNQSQIEHINVGHVHLQVGDSKVAQDFYVDVLGFETTATFHGAVFVSAGGYHHHMAMNAWNSSGAGPRAATLGLARVDITLPERSDLDAVAERLKHYQIQVADDGAELSFLDPWNNPIALRTPQKVATLTE